VQHEDPRTRNAKGRLIAILLTGGDAHDCPAAERLIRRVKSAKRMLGDKVYDSAELREELDERGTRPAIFVKPGRSKCETLTSGFPKSGKACIFVINQDQTRFLAETSVRPTATPPKAYGRKSPVAPARPRNVISFLTRSVALPFSVQMCRIPVKYLSWRSEMQSVKLVLAAAGVACAGIVATTNLAGAQDYILTASECVAPPPPPLLLRWYITYYPNYFVPNWDPFFRRHVYRYGPIVVCSAIATPPIISSKY
jgi:hypothetical protein